MGKQVVYCDGCGRILLEDDFAQSRASLSDNRCYCSDCRLPPVAPAPGRAARPKRDRIAAAGGASATPPGTKRASSSRLQRPSSGELRRVTVEPVPGRSRAPLIVGGGLAGLGVLLLIGVLASSGKGRTSADRAPDEPAVEGRKAPAPTTTPPPSEDADVKAFLKAVEFRKLHPTDLGGHLRRFEEVARSAGGRPVGEDARREIALLRRKLAEARDAVESEAAALLAAERFGRAIEVWDRARTQFQDPEWEQHASGRAVAIRDVATARYPEVRARAVEARRRDAAAEVSRLLDRIARWGLPDFKSDLERVLAATAVEKAAPAAKPVDPAPAPVRKESDAWEGRWKAALQRASARDYAAALKSLQEPAPPPEKAADLEALRGAAAIAGEAGALLAKVSKGQKLSLGWFEASGARVAAEGTVAAADAHRIELRQGSESWLIPVGEVTGSSLADLARPRAGRKPEDARAAALLCVLEGDAEGARKQGAALPADYEALAREIAEAHSASADREDEARRRFHQAEWGSFDPGLQYDAVATFKSLLSELGDTRFVRRNRTAIESRMEIGRDFLFGASDLGSRGSFRLGRHNKVDSCWISEKDVDEASLKTNFVEIRFPALPDAEYKCWVCVGGCCLETFAFAIQGTELSGPDARNPKETVRAEPGGDSWVSARLPYLPLKKLHEMHTGPKEPDRWEWIAIPLPRYASPGTKTVRLLSRQKGFSVAAAAVSARRTGPPRDGEVREAERARVETPGYAVWKSVGVPAGAILREVWTDVGGGAVADLRNLPTFPDKPSASHQAAAFETPVNWADNYGTLMRGYVYPPATGEYVFWVSGDDQCELWLSTDDQPKNKARIAVVPEWSEANEWAKFPQQQSAPVVLKAGRRYYIEALQKEGGGGDSLSVGWKLPEGILERPIPGSRLSPFRR